MQKNFDIFRLRLKELQGSESVSAFARRLAMPQNTLDCYMRGARKPSVEVLTRVCDICQVSADWLLGREPSKATVPDRVSKTLPPLADRSNAVVLAELEALKRRVRALEDAAGSPSFACG